MQVLKRYNLQILMPLVFITGSVFSSASHAASPNWSEWERANAISKKGKWLVVRQPNEGFCYIKQGYEGSSNKMDLSMKADDTPYLTTPFYEGIEGDVSYRVDDGQLRIVPEDKASSTGIELSSDVVPELRRGRELIVRIKPVNRRTLEQKFDLSGFTAANGMLASAACRKKVGDQYSY